MDAIQVVAIVVSVLLLLLVLDLVRRQKLTEEYSFVWIICALALLVLSIFRRALDRIALALGIYYPPAALLIVLILFVFLASISFSMVVSRQRQRIERLVEDAALLEARVRELGASIAAQRSIGESTREIVDRPPSSVAR
jgi:hypothetical protein